LTTNRNQSARTRFEKLAVNKEGWRQRLAQCVFDTGWTKL